MSTSMTIQNNLRKNSNNFIKVLKPILEKFPVFLRNLRTVPEFVIEGPLAETFSPLILIMHCPFQSSINNAFLF